jgi:hypothetical protein
MDKMFATSLALIVVGALAFTSAGASGDTAQCTADLGTADVAASASVAADMTASIEPVGLADDASLAKDVSLANRASPLEGRHSAAGEGVAEEDGSLPKSVALRPIPARYASGYAIYEQYRYAVFDGDEVIVDPTTRQIIAKLR